MADQFEYPECPSCGGEVYNNVAKNRERVAAGQKAMPDFKCKAECGWLKWPAKAKTSAGSAKASAPREPKWTSETLERTYATALDIAVRQVKRVTTKATPADLFSVAATLFIAASRDGIKPTPAEKLATEPDMGEGDETPF